MPTIAPGQVIPLTDLFNPAQMGGWGASALSPNGGWTPGQDASQPTLAPTPYAPPAPPPTIATQPPDDGEFDVAGAISTAARGASTLGRWADAPGLTAAGNVTGGALNFATGLMEGDPSAAIGGAARLGGTLANLGGYPEVASGFNAIGGPLSFATGLAHGNPLQAASGAIQTASTISGWMGGPTISSLTAPVTNAIGEFLSPVTTAVGNALGFGGGGGASAAGAAGAGAAAEGAGFASGMAASIAPMAAAAPFVMMLMGGFHAAMTGGGDMFDSMFGEDRTQAIKQRDEYKRATSDLGQYLPERRAGAEIFNRLPEITAPEDVLASLETATRGMWAGERLGPAVIQVNNGQKAARIKGKDLSGLIDAMPEMESTNVASWLTLMDRAQALGLDTSRILTKDAPTGMSDDHLTRMGMPVEGGRYRTANVSLLGPNQDSGSGPGYTVNTGEGETFVSTAGQVYEHDWSGNLDAASRIVSTQEALDLSRAIGSLGTIMGIDPVKLPGGGWDDKTQTFKEGALNRVYRGYGGYLAPDQLAAAGLSPGNYAAGTLNFLRQIDPAVAQTAAFKAYQTKMGVTDEQLAQVAAATAPLGAPRSGLGGIEDGLTDGTLSQGSAMIRLMDMGYPEDEAGGLVSRLSTLARGRFTGSPDAGGAGEGDGSASGDGGGGGPGSGAGL